ncbi:MAG TPA: response regulator [Gemmataceae bacterium]|nr:response regulator [Gemmataceae bacterium]
MALILVVDYGRHSREYLLSRLQENGYDVLSAADGRQALGLARERRPDLVITDVFLPGMDGYEFVHQLRSDPALATIPIIFYTVAYHAHEVRTLSRACGVDHVILKASQPEQLLEAIQAVLARQAPAASTEGSQQRAAHDLAARLQEAEGVNRRLGALVELSRQLTAEQEPLRLLHNFCHAARAIIGARLAALGILDDSGQALAHFFSSGVAAPVAFQMAALSPQRGVLGRLLREGQPVRYQAGVDGFEKDFPAPHPPVDSFLGVPVATASRGHGWLYLVGRYGTEQFNEEDERIAVTLAAQIALAYESAVRHEQGERHAARLEQEIQRRQQLEQQLQQQVNELAEADRRKDRFLGMLAHELRNPLAPIGNALRVMQLAPPDSTASQRARKVVERQYQHLTRLVNDLLEVSRVTRGTIELRPARVDLGRLVRTSAEDHRGLIQLKNLVLRLELPPLPIWVDGDATRLAQVLDHLIQNAVRFTEQGGRIDVQATADAATGQAIVRVRDTGAGIAPDLLPQLFQSFIQADRSLDRSRGGLGLGLALVKGLVELHGGQVWASSAGLGQGAEFGFRLPLREAVASVVKAPAASPPRGHGHVLIIEDNPDTAATLRMLLELSGYDVAVAGTGPDGVECALRLRPDVILCDIGLPGGMDGYAVARTVRQNPATAHTRLIAVTGYGRDEDRRRCREAGFDLHFTKPVDPEELTTHLLADTPS